MKQFKKIGLAVALTAGVFTLASCNSEPAKNDVEAAAKKLVLTQDKKEDVTANFKVTSLVKADGVNYTVTWTSNNTVATVGELDGQFYTIVIDYENNTEAAATVTLTGTLTDPDDATNTFSKTFTFTVPKCEGVAGGTCDGVRQAIKDIASQDKAIDVRVNTGKVMGILTGKGFVLGDETGYVYVYTNKDPEVAVGDIVTVTGKGYRYYGTPQIASPTIVKLTGKTVTPAAAVEKTISEIAAISDTTSLLMGSYVKSSAKIKVLNKADGYKYDNTVLLVDPADETKFVLGYNYNSDLDYLVPLDGMTIDICYQVHDRYANYDFGGDLGKKDTIRINYFDGKPNVELTDEQKANAALLEVGISPAAEYFENAEIALPQGSTSYPNATVAWTVTGSGVAINNGKAVITLGEASAEATLTVTVTVGDKTATKNYTIKTVVVTDVTFVTTACTIIDALAKDNENSADQYIIVGTVAEVTTAYNATYKNVSFTLTDGVQTLTVYRYAGKDAETIAAGQVIAIKGNLQRYVKNNNKTYEVTNGTEYCTLTSLANAAAAGVAGTGVAGTNVYGKVSAITTAYNSQYKNITITLSDGTNTLSCYRLAGGEDLAVGDYILVTGTPSAHNGTAQMAAGATYIKDTKYVAPELTDAEAVEAVKTELAKYAKTINADLALAATFTIANYDGTVAVTYKVGDTAVTSIAYDEPATATEVTVVATITCGSAAAVDYTFKVTKAAKTTLPAGTKQATMAFTVTSNYDLTSDSVANSTAMGFGSDIKVAYNQGNSSNNSMLYVNTSGNQLRIYDGTSITISCANSAKKIKSITIKCASVTDNKNDLSKLTYTIGTDGTATAFGTGKSTDAVTVTVDNNQVTLTASGSQIRIVEIIIVYEE